MGDERWMKEQEEAATKLKIAYLNATTYEKKAERYLRLARRAYYVAIGCAAAALIVVVAVLWRACSK